MGFKARTRATDAADEALIERLRVHFAGERAVSERPMFGGLTFMLRGNMCCGVLRGDLIVRVPPDELGAALDEPHAAPMAFTGRPLRGFVQVAPAGYASNADLARWVGRGERVARSLPPK